MHCLQGGGGFLCSAGLVFKIISLNWFGILWQITCLWIGNSIWQTSFGGGVQFCMVQKSAFWNKCLTISRFLEQISSRFNWCAFVIIYRQEGWNNWTKSNRCSAQTTKYRLYWMTGTFNLPKLFQPSFLVHLKLFAQSNFCPLHKILDFDGCTNSTKMYVCRAFVLKLTTQNWNPSFLLFFITENSNFSFDKFPKFSSREHEGGKRLLETSFVHPHHQRILVSGSPCWFMYKQMIDGYN